MSPSPHDFNGVFVGGPLSVLRPPGFEGFGRVLGHDLLDSGGRFCDPGLGYSRLL